MKKLFFKLNEGKLKAMQGYKTSVKEIDDKLESMEE